MPSKKKKYNARFPAGRIKKIMQTDEEVGKVAQAVPVIISRTLELFVESLLTKSMQITQSRNAKTLTPSHMKQCILSESRFDFLKDLVKNIPDASAQEDFENNALFEASSHKEQELDAANNSSSESPPPMNLSQEQSTSGRTPVIQFGPKVTPTTEKPKLNFTVSRLLNTSEESKLQINIATTEQVPSIANNIHANIAPKLSTDNIPPLIPISHNYYSPNTSDNLCIDEDYDN